MPHLTHLRSLVIELRATDWGLDNCLLVVKPCAVLTRTATGTIGACTGQGAQSRRRSELVQNDEEGSLDIARVFLGGTKLRPYGTKNTGYAVLCRISRCPFRLDP